MPLIEGGYFITSRKLLESGIMDKPPEYLKVWVYLLGKAYHTPKNNLQRGQGFTSIPELIEVLSYKVGYRIQKPTKKKVFGIIEWLRNPNEGDYEGNAKEPMIETTKVTHGFVYTIVKYNLYQNPKNYESNDEGNDEEPMKVQRREQKGNNKYKNLKNYKNDNLLLLSISKEESYPQFYDWLEEKNIEVNLDSEEAYYLKYLHERSNYYYKTKGKEHPDTIDAIKAFEERKALSSQEIVLKAQSI